MKIEPGELIWCYVTGIDVAIRAGWMRVARAVECPVERGARERRIWMRKRSEAGKPVRDLKREWEMFHLWRRGWAVESVAALTGRDVHSVYRIIQRLKRENPNVEQDLAVEALLT